MLSFEFSSQLKRERLMTQDVIFHAGVHPIYPFTSVVGLCGEGVLLAQLFECRFLQGVETLSHHSQYLFIAFCDLFVIVSFPPGERV